MWGVGRVTIQPLVKAVSRLHVYGKDRVPREGGLVVACNHFSWIDPPALGAACPRTIYYMAKIEAHVVPGLGSLIRAFGAFPVRRGESDREAVRLMRQCVRDGDALGLFAEGSRQREGVPGDVMPGAAMVALQERVPVVAAAIHGTQFWKPGNFAPCSIAVGEPFMLDGLPKGGRGYKEGSLEIERRIRVLFDWLAEVHSRGRPKGLVPPTGAPEPAAVEDPVV